MSEAAIYHVVPSGSVWAVKARGERQALRLAPTRDGAYAHAERLAREQGPVRVILHRPDGAIARQVIVEAEEPLARRPLPLVTAAVVATALAGGALAAWWARR